MAHAEFGQRAVEEVPLLGEDVDVADTAGTAPATTIAKKKVAVWLRW